MNPLHTTQQPNALELNVKICGCPCEEHTKKTETPKEEVKEEVYRVKPTTEKDGKETGKGKTGQMRKKPTPKHAAMKKVTPTRPRKRFPTPVIKPLKKVKKTIGKPI